MIAYAKLHVLMARESRLAVVIRHGTAKSVCTLRWNRATDEFTLGQWIRGRIDTATCDLSPDGEHFIYTASRSYLQVNFWTVVSRPPYLKAVAYYPWRGCGGWFVNNRDYCVVGHGGSRADDREHPYAWRVEAEAPKPGLYAAQMMRAGWTLDGTLGFVREAGHGWTLRRSSSGLYALSCGDRRADTNGWDWADVDGRRLVWTVKGCLWAGRVGKEGLEDVRLLHDFNGMKFEAIAAPYEEGRPVVARAPVVAVVALPARARKKGRIRKKPVRARVRVEDD